MEFEPTAAKSQEGVILSTTTITTRQIFVGLCLAIATAVLVVSLCVGAYRLGVQTASAGIYKERNGELLALIGIVDQAKGRELASCADSGRSDCMSVIAPVVTP